MLLKRVLTAAVLIPALTLTILYGKGWPFLLFVGVAAFLCAVEYARMFFPAARDRRVGVALTCLVYAAGALLPYFASLPAVLFCLMLAVFHFLRFRGPAGERLRFAALAALGAAYIGGFFSAYPRLIVIPRGQYWILMGVVAIAAGDTAAYFAGRAFGKRRLSPEISPNKTVEGALGGLLASVVCATAFAAVFLVDVPVWYAALAAGVVGVVGQGGDLFESMIKRAAGVKDSGTMLPGHGGLFDRSDSIIASGPALYLLAILPGIAGGAGKGLLG